MKKDMTINLSKFESTHLRMLFAKEICALFGSNWLNGWENGKIDYRKTNDKQQVITEARLSFQLRWANYLISFFIQGCFLPSLVVMCPVVLEKMKMWKVYTQTNTKQQMT